MSDHDAVEQVITMAWRAQLAESWTPDPSDEYGEDKRRFIRYLIDNDITARNPRPIGWILDHCVFERSYEREQFQQLIVGPLRRDRKVFIGWSGVSERSKPATTERLKTSHGR